MLIWIFLIVVISYILNQSFIAPKIKEMKRKSNNSEIGNNQNDLPEYREITIKKCKKEGNNTVNKSV